MKLKWRHIGLLPGLAVLALGLWCYVDTVKAGGSSADPWYIIPIDLLLSILPGALLLGVYWWALRTAQLERGRDIVLARGYLLLGLAFLARFIGSDITGISVRFSLLGV